MPDVLEDLGSVNLSGIINIPNAGTPVAGPDVHNNNGFIIKAHPSNGTSMVWVFSTGQTKASGFPLAVGDQVILAAYGLDLVSFDADANNCKICWLRW